MFARVISLNGKQSAARFVARSGVCNGTLAGRYLSTSRFLLQEAEKSKGKAGKSVLTDDMLSKAGIDLDDPLSEGAKDPVEPAEPAAGKKRGGRRRQTSSEIKRERYANWFYVFSLAGLVGTCGYMCRDWDSDEPEEMVSQVERGYAPSLMYQRFKLRFNSLFSYFQEPPFPDLLPPPPPAPYQRPLTLVLTLEDLLVHSEWSQKTGWRTAKRPGVDYFLGYLSQYYEIVLFSSNYMMYSERIAEKLDPLHAFISYNLFKEHCVYKDHVHIKDLSKLNRDVRKVVIMDTDANSYKLQPENALPMAPWDGKPDDKLIQMIPFLEYLATQQVDDVRPVLGSFPDRREIPSAFAQRVSKLREKYTEDQAKKAEGNWALKLLGVGATAGGARSKFPLDLIRDEGEKNYVRFMKLIDEEKEKLRIQQEKMAGKTTFTLKDYVEGNVPTQSNRWSSS
ncbi:protein translocase subunit TIM50 KNAG_0A02060 [Huiozyma naganishii CBS 8797]|uniref:Mitochondrial import inner membrane translocase subunit TIM50 n=1 Tax=Huiozyma naganishii (strain ATCC MYA-139 / BCRC 22969 / CBS 8797 / KCTC 17520 / NBRC 10181 / NCYC 3082 / Yp74L-3) TaxID=1071383 RepID=J7QZJ1_HUIN7|nr:hypothetical protein KNAG_0A02060 [Kazachstania naganishii CBS 8797]CCK67895.1 hypothetical protein KNAG_0A02060 [Kazachstania naganishii CBS 8797]